MKQTTGIHDGGETDGRSSIMHDVTTQLNVLQPNPPEITNQPIPSPATTGGGPSTVSPYVVTEDDGHVQTLHRMTEGTQSIPRPSENSDELHNYEAVEYFDTFNSIAILGQALGHRQRRRLIRLDLPGSDWPSQRQRELNGLDPVDVAYLESRGVFAKPPKSAWCVFNLTMIDVSDALLAKRWFVCGLSSFTHTPQFWIGQSSTKNLPKTSALISCSIPF